VFFNNAGCVFAFPGHAPNVFSVTRAVVALGPLVTHVPKVPSFFTPRKFRVSLGQPASIPPLRSKAFRVPKRGPWILVEGQALPCIGPRPGPAPSRFFYPTPLFSMEVPYDLPPSFTIQLFWCEDSSSKPIAPLLWITPVSVLSRLRKPLYVMHRCFLFFFTFFLPAKDFGASALD